MAKENLIAVLNQVRELKEKLIAAQSYERAKVAKDKEKMLLTQIEGLENN